MKTLKNFGLLAGVFALILGTFSSCDPKDPDIIVEDGFYVIGEATGSTALSVDYRMATGNNEADKNNARAGLYEKYVALEANKEFTLLLKEGAVETKYSAVLAEVDLKGESEQPNITILKGTLLSGTAATPMKVTTSGLYHIVLDLNTNGDLANPVILVAPVEWGVRGVNGDWSWKKLKASAFNRTTMTFDTTFAEIPSSGIFKFSYGGGWKIQLDDAGSVRVNTNLGLDLVQGAGDIPMPKGTDIHLKLTWKLAGGELSKSYKMEMTGNIIIEDPATFVVGFSGSAFGSNTNAPAEWSDPSGPTLAVYDAANSSVTNQQTKAGKYVYNITNLKMDAAKEFKVRVNGAWIGFDDATIVGETFTKKSDGNFIVGAAATYTNVKFEVTWSGTAATETKVTFTK